MKKLFYIIITAVILVALGFFTKQYLANNEAEIIVVEEEILPLESEDSFETEDTEPEAEDVVETNPEETADEGETFVD